MVLEQDVESAGEDIAEEAVEEQGDIGGGDQDDDEGREEEGGGFLEMGQPLKVETVDFVGGEPERGMEGELGDPVSDEAADGGDSSGAGGRLVEVVTG